MLAWPSGSESHPRWKPAVLTPRCVIIGMAYRLWKKLVFIGHSSCFFLVRKLTYFSVLKANDSLEQFSQTPEREKGFRRGGLELFKFNAEISFGNL